jgi:transposase
MFEPLTQAMLDQQMTERLFHNGETRWMVFETICGKIGYRWYLWITQSASVVYYRITPGRGSDVPIEHFSGIPEDILKVIVVCDRYSAYKKLAGKCSFILLAFCWAHVRRDFLDAARSWPEYEQWMQSWVDDIGQLYKLNAARLEHWDESRPLAAQSQAFAKQQLMLTQKLSQVVARRDEHLKDQQLAYPKKKVLESLKNHWHGLTLFVAHPQVPMDNNTAERGIRTPVAGRKNFYGSGSTWSAILAAMMFTILKTILLWGINPRRRLDSFLSACAENGGAPPSDLSSFLPWQMDEQRKQTLSRPPPARTPSPDLKFESFDSS